MAAFASASQVAGLEPAYTMSVLPNTWTTHAMGYTTGYVTNAMNVRLNDPLYPGVPLTPVGRPLRMPPQEGTWIAERAKGAKSRKIIEVLCGRGVVCEGKRHSVIAWKNLGRYIEVNPPWDSCDWRASGDPLKSP